MEAGKIELPHIPDGCVHNGHMFYIKTRDMEERSALIDFMKQKEILACFTMFPSIPLLRALSSGGLTGEDKYTTRESERLLRLPMFYQLKEEEVDYIADKVKEFYGR